MDGDQPASDLVEQYRHAVHNMPVDNPPEYLKEIKRLQGLMLNIEFEHLDYDQEPEQVTKDVKEIKKNVRQLLSPAFLCAIQDRESDLGEEQTPEEAVEQQAAEHVAASQSSPEQLANKGLVFNEAAVENPVPEESIVDDLALNGPLTEQAGITDTAVKKKKKRKSKKKKKSTSDNTTVADPVADFFDIPDIHKDGLLRHLRTIHLQSIRPKSSNDEDSEEYKAELVNNLSQELWRVKVKVAEIACTHQLFGDKIQGNLEMVKAGVEVDKIQLRDLTKEVEKKIKGVKAELKDVKMEPNKFKVELEDMTKELNEAKTDLNGYKRDLNATKKELKGTKEELTEVRQELSDTKSELSDVKKKNEEMAEKMDEMYAWFEKQKELAVSHFF
ncbi:hypothetical protein QM012_005526 [Aureobasidium pullulans]|uniref:Uncharacterized protein n=1 Tax=Aureobasidium pullulans TaxID=5580 RepID=A0ABR0T4N8_AURPU